MPLKKYVQTAGERKRYTINYSDWLDTGELLTGVTFSVSSPVTTPPLLIDDVMVAPDFKSAQYYVSSGIDDTQYEVVVMATTATGQIKEDTILFNIREPL